MVKGTYAEAGLHPHKFIAISYSNGVWVDESKAVATRSLGYTDKLTLG